MVSAALSDPDTAPVSAAVRAALRFLETLTLRPDDLSPADVDGLRAAGLTDQAIRDAATVCALFSTITRLADTLNFAIPPTFDHTVKVVTSRLGYRLPPFLLLLPRA